jgi:hypothetical protein
MTLAGRPIAAQYGVYAHSCGYNWATLSRAPIGRKLMIVRRLRAFGLIAAFLVATAGQAAELPSQRHVDKPKQAEAAKKCNVGGNPGVLAANNVCVRMSGYVSSQFGAGQFR